jgi:hypothetical protein
MNFKEYKNISFNCFDMYKRNYKISKKSKKLISIFKYCIKNLNIK